MSSQTPEQRQHLRRILAAFFVVVICVPLTALEGYWTWALIPALIAAVLAVREMVGLRRSVRRSERSAPPEQ